MQLIHRQVARQRPLGQGVDEGGIVAGFAQELLVVEEHPRFRVLRDGVGAVRALCRRPERGKDRAEVLGIFGDVVVELEDEAVLLEGADPFVRGDEHVRPLVDAEHFQELQRVVVEALGRALAHRDLDALGRTFGLELLVQPLGSLDHIAGAQRPGRVLARPELEFHGLLRVCRHCREDGRRAAHQNLRSEALRQFHSSSESSCYPPGCDTLHRVVMLLQCCATRL